MYFSFLGWVPFVLPTVQGPVPQSDHGLKHNQSLSLEENTSKREISSNTFTSLQCEGCQPFSLSLHHSESQLSGNKDTTLYSGETNPLRFLHRLRFMRLWAVSFLKASKETQRADRTSEISTQQATASKHISMQTLKNSTSTPVKLIFAVR